MYIANFGAVAVLYFIILAENGGRTDIDTNIYCKDGRKLNYRLFFFLIKTIIDDLNPRAVVTTNF